MSCYDCGKKNDTLVNRLNKRVTIQRPVESRADSGSTIIVYEDVATVWAAIEPLRGREFFAAFAEHAEVTTRIRIRYREGIDRTMVVKYGTTLFEVLHIIRPNFNNVELQLMSKERQ
ncbi:head-tail adaptor protein [Paenibacillus sp. 1011MAR3C5]|uniref:phage head closure protein n=1 Tax=Paenibacillus sp. 1011MAR3C5 TaxID=1675787 RepID=UPI000E6C460A|nr:phage head closure protein [Paenibacillus sp. 1011MAR3C5]RJE88622.1 head-tail adaptor protein [Paenibacillus sp. 1011MAR3C5]